MHDELHEPQTMAEDAAPQRLERIPSQRRKHLFQVALEVAERVEQLTKPHERRLLRRMIEFILD